MGLFRRSSVGPAGSAAPVQIPDKLAQRAQLEYGNSNFVAAAELFSEAVDKLHTMYVVGGCTYRQPSPADALITEGLLSSVGAALAMNEDAPVKSLIEKSSNYLGEIDQMPQARSAGAVYESAINELARIFSRLP